MDEILVKGSPAFMHRQLCTKSARQVSSSSRADLGPHAARLADGMLALLHTGLSLVDPSPAAAAQLLGVKLGSLDRATVRLAYRRAAARSHPDVSESPDAGEHFVDVTTAAQVLRTYLDQSRSATAAAAR